MGDLLWEMPFHGFLIVFPIPLLLCILKGEDRSRTLADRAQILDMLQVPGGHELFLLSQLEDLKNEIEKRQAKNATKPSEEISQLDTPTQGQEEKNQSSVSEFIQFTAFQWKIVGGVVLPTR